MTPALQSSIHLHKRYTCVLHNSTVRCGREGGGGGEGGQGGARGDFFLLLSTCTLLASVLLPCMEMVYMYTQLYIRSYYNTLHV